MDEKTNTIKRVLARKEIILSAGVIDSPKLLMLSGIGPSKDLKKVGIEVISDLPVGMNLHDHVAIIPLSISLNRMSTSLQVKTIEKKIIIERR